jgi:hypothetical protein
MPVMSFIAASLARPDASRIRRRGQLANPLTGFLDNDGEHLSATAAIPSF